MDDKQRIAMVETRTKGDDGSAARLTRYQLGNHLGSASLELDEAGRIVSYEEYFPYGSTSYQSVDASVKAAAKRYRYTGKERDEETGLNYHGARYCAPWLGRWTSADPVPNVNLYAYAANNPEKLVDPDGAAALPDDPNDPLFDPQGRWMRATPGAIEEYLRARGWEFVEYVRTTRGDPRPEEGLILRSPQNDPDVSYARIMHRGGVSGGSQDPRVNLTRNNPQRVEVSPGVWDEPPQQWIDRYGKSSSIGQAHLPVTDETINPRVLQEYRMAVGREKKAREAARRNRNRKGFAIVGANVFMAVALTNATIAIVSADTWEQRFEVGAALAISEASGAALVARYGPRAATGIGLIFSLIGAAGVHRQREQAVSAFLHSEFGDIDWGSLPSEDRTRLQREAWDLLFNTPPMSVDEFFEMRREEWGGTDIDEDTELDDDPEPDVDVDQQRQFELHH
jgi:RHS repeat-associated protein